MSTTKDSALDKLSAKGSVARTATTATSATTAASTKIINATPASTISASTTAATAKVITIILSGGFHPDPTSCFFLSQYIEKNIQWIKNSGLKMAVGLEPSLDANDYLFRLKKQLEICKFYEWVKQARLKSSNNSPLGTTDLRATLKEIEESPMDDKYKKDLFVQKQLIDGERDELGVLALKAHVNLTQLLLKHDIPAFKLESLEDGPDYTSEIKRNESNRGVAAYEEFEKERIEKMIKAIGRSIKNLETTGGLIAVPSLGLIHLQRLKFHILQAFKDKPYVINVYDFYIPPPQYGILLRNYKDQGNEKQWTRISDMDINYNLKLTEQVINKVDSEETKKYYTEHPYSEVAIKQNENGDFYCPELSQLLDSVISQYPQTSLNLKGASPTTTATATATAATTATLISSNSSIDILQPNFAPWPLETTSIIKWRNEVDPWLDNIKPGSKEMHYGIQAGVDKDSKIAIRATQCSFFKDGELWVGIGLGMGKPIYTLLKLYKQKGQEFYIHPQSLRFLPDETTKHFKIKIKIALKGSSVIYEDSDDDDVTNNGNLGETNIIPDKPNKYQDKTFTFTQGLVGDIWIEDPFYPPQVFGHKNNIRNTVDEKNLIELRKIKENKTIQLSDSSNTTPPSFNSTPNIAATTTSITSITSTTAQPSFNTAPSIATTSTATAVVIDNSMPILELATSKSTQTSSPEGKTLSFEEDDLAAIFKDNNSFLSIFEVFKNTGKNVNDAGKNIESTNLNKDASKFSGKFG